VEKLDSNIAFMLSLLIDEDYIDLSLTVKESLYLVGLYNPSTKVFKQTPLVRSALHQNILTVCVPDPFPKVRY